MKLPRLMESTRIQPMDEIFGRLIGNGFSELAGLTVDASIPVPEYIVNEMIESALRGNKNITACRMSIGGNNLVTVQLKTPLWFAPIHLKLELEKSVDFSGSPKVKARLENLVLLGKLGSFFKALPKGFSLIGDRIVVDLDSLISTQEYKKLLDLVKSVEVRTEAGGIIFNVKIKVEEK